MKRKSATCNYVLRTIQALCEKEAHFFLLRYLQLGPDAVSMIPSVAAVTQHHAFCIPFLATHFAASIEDGLGPDDTSIQRRQMKEDLGQAGRRKK